MNLLDRFDRAVSRFLRQHPRFGIRNLMLYLVIGNALIFLLSRMDRSGMLLSYLAFQPVRLLRGELWRLFTFVFVPGASGLLSLVLLLYFYYFIGSTLEREWGTARFTVYYLLGMLLTIVYGLLASLLGRPIALTGSYINLSMFFVFATLFPENRILLFFIIPIRIKWLAIAEAVLFVISMISGRTLLPLVAVLNYFLFCGAELLRRFPTRRLRRTTPFRRPSAPGDSHTQSYTRKCSVCGKTDTDYPELEFRYCSRCVGYHCFCSEHIGSHIHFVK